jgi:hypothetical protein
MLAISKEELSIGLKSNKSFNVCSGSKFRVLLVSASTFGVLLFMSLHCHSADLPGKVADIAVNGGADTANPGTTCIKMDVAVDSSCTGGWIAIPNNNSRLFNGVLTAKALGSPVILSYISDGTKQQHCPSLAFTPCQIVSVIVK